MRVYGNCGLGSRRDYLWVLVAEEVSYEGREIEEGWERMCIVAERYWRCFSGR